MQTKRQFMVALLISISTSLLLAPVVVADTAHVGQVGIPAMDHEIISLSEEEGPRTETNQTTTTETQPPELNPITIGLIGCIDIGLAITLVFFIVKRK
ncbi:MAG: hypothetical protein JSW05_09340 [Candidatus Thorarchaeota archaeon]|nr:MAG: hypothetical protein JSW05_09340 [Candidatus Thorarchaeota archaeon]